MAEKDKITIYLGSTLRARMEKYKDTTWAHVAQKAFEREMDLQDAREGLSWEAVLKRLNNDNEADHITGRNEGEQWIAAWASWDQVMALADRHPNAPDIWEPSEVDEAGHAVGYVPGELMYQSWFGMEDFQKRPSRYIAGFMDAATEAAEKVWKLSRAN